MSQKKRKEWVCSKGCDLSKGICPHLEDLLPSMHKGNSNRLRYFKDIDVLNPDSSLWDTDFNTIDDFIDTLDYYNITEFEKGLLIDRYYYDMSLSDIAELHDVVGGGSAVYTYIKRILARMKEQDTEVGDA